MADFGRWKYTADRDATIAAYAQEPHGFTKKCGCATCRNFDLARGRIFPPAFFSLLDRLGIDPEKEAEAYHNAQLAPGRHDYGGWYHFVGTLDETGDFPPVDFGDGFTVWMSRAGGPKLASLKGAKTVQLEFHSDAVPWLLDEPEPR
ncbi:MAG TPA: hypothetical protein VGU20_03870 [Stellaceae bacterium]|nr:hypothetical protein [Stellaceae bacterium]